MGLLDRLFETRSYPATDDFWYQPMAPSMPTNSGVRVSPETAMRCSTVLACVRVLSESIASLPLLTYRRLPDGGKERAIDYPLYRVLHDQPHPEITSNQWLDVMVTHMALTGNHYSELVASNRGIPAYLLPWNPTRTKVERLDSGEKVYTLTQTDGKPRVRKSDQMLHIPDMTWDGMEGLSRVSFARETIGFALAGEEFGARFFSNGAHPGLVVTMPEGIRPEKEDHDRLINEINTNYASLGNAHKALVLTGGMKANEVGIPPQDAQYLEIRKFQRTEIASIYRIPLHMIQEHEKSTSWGTGIQQMSIGFVVYTLRPWLVKIEQALNMTLIPKEDQDEYFVEFLVDGLLRGDQAQRSAYYATMIQNQVMVPNEVRALENMNPIEGGDEPVRQQNIFGAAGSTPPKSDEEDKDEEGRSAAHRAELETRDGITRKAIQSSYADMIAEAVERVLKRERNDVIRNVKKLAGKRSDVDVAEWLDDYYTGKHRKYSASTVGPALEALAIAIGAEAMAEIGKDWALTVAMREWIDGYIESWALGYTSSNLTQLTQIVDEGGDIVQGIIGRFDEWQDGRSIKIGGAESTKISNKFTRSLWKENGITELVWRNTGSKSCPYCESLDGRVVGIEEAFLAADEDFKPEGAKKPLTPSRNVFEPPAHGGCVCVIVPGG